MNNSKKTTTHTNRNHIRIEPKRGWFDVNLRELWQYRDLILLFAKRNFTIIYKQTVLGPAWIILQPLMTTLIFTLVFGKIAGISTDGVPQVLFYMGGTALWHFFSTCVTKTSATFTANARIFGKVYFPRLVVPISTVLSSATHFAVQLGIFLVLWFWFLLRGEISPNFYGILFFPAVAAYIGLLGLGCGIIVSSLTTKYRDLSMLVSFGIQLWMYVTPVVYPVSVLEEGWIRTFVRLNPVTEAVEAFRWMFLGVGQPEPLYCMISVGMMIAVVTVGVMIFSRIEKNFMDTV